MRKILLLSIFSLFSCYAIAQVGVGTDLPNPSTQLDVEANDKGILIPRIQLASITDQQTITAGNVESLLVFNTETNAEVVPGYYYWYNGEWRKLLVSGEYSNETITFLTDNADGTFIYTNEDGTQVTFDANTVTYTDNGNGSYTFTNANGDSLTIDVVGDVVTNIQNQGDIYDEIINMLDTNSDIFVDNGDGTFTHTAVDGTQVTFDANTVTYTDNGNGSYTFTNANGQTLTVEYFAENGLSQTNNTFQLGGNLIQPTAITTTATNTLAIEGLQDGHSPTHDVVVMDAQGILKKVKAAMPKFFYMPSILVPTSSDQVPAGETYGVIDLYDKYQDQFGGTGAVPLVTNTSNAGNTLPVLPATELNYYVTWYDTSVFYNVSISNNGVLNYSVYNTSAVTESSFMNIVFEVK